MLTLYYTPGACSMAAHIVLEESGEEYEAKKVDLAGGEQRTEAYLKINPLGRVPALLLDNGEPLAENTAILPFLGKRFDLWPEDAVAEAKALSLIGFFASSVHVAFAHVSRPERYASDSTAFPTLKDTGLKAFHGYLKQIDGMLAEREWFSDRYTVLDPYGFVFYTWGVRRQLPMGELKNYTAFKNRMLERPPVGRVVDGEQIKVSTSIRALAPCDYRTIPFGTYSSCYMSANITGKPRAFLPYFEGGASERCLEPSSSIVTFMVRRSLGCDEHCAAIAPPAALAPRFFNDG